MMHVRVAAGKPLCALMDAAWHNILLLFSVGGTPFFVFFQAEDGIRDIGVTGVQTCALPIYGGAGRLRPRVGARPGGAEGGALGGVRGGVPGDGGGPLPAHGRRVAHEAEQLHRSAERRGGEEGRTRGAPDPSKKTHTQYER